MPDDRFVYRDARGVEYVSVPLLRLSLELRPDGDL